VPWNQFVVARLLDFHNNSLGLRRSFFLPLLPLSQILTYLRKGRRLRKQAKKQLCVIWQGTIPLRNPTSTPQSHYAKVSQWLVCSIHYHHSINPYWLTAFPYQRYHENPRYAHAEHMRFPCTRTIGVDSASDESVTVLPPLGDLMLLWSGWWQDGDRWWQDYHIRLFQSVSTTSEKLKGAHLPTVRGRRYEQICRWTSRNIHKYPRCTWEWVPAHASIMLRSILFPHQNIFILTLYYTQPWWWLPNSKSQFHSHSTKKHPTPLSTHPHIPPFLALRPCGSHYS